jgi:hypothetical protein
MPQDLQTDIAGRENLNLHMIVTDDLAVTKLDFPRVEDDLPTSKQDNDATGRRSGEP